MCFLFTAACEPGQGFTLANDGCEDCERGTYQDNPLEGVCYDCPEGETTLFSKADSQARCGGKIFARIINC